MCLRDTRFTHAQIHPEAVGALSEYGSCLRAVVISDVGSSEAHERLGADWLGTLSSVMRLRLVATYDPIDTWRSVPSEM